MITAQKVNALERAGYRIIGRHSAVKVCHWTKKSLLDKGVCYKELFYGKELGIRSHRCLQITPALPFCDHRCVFCWRDTDLTDSVWQGEADDPSAILEGALRAQTLLLSGFGGGPGVNRKKFEESKKPVQCAISLAGEPTFYPKLPELIDKCEKMGLITFLVSNGQHPEVIERIRPTQLYISIAAPDRETYERVCRPAARDGWDRLMESLSTMKNIGCRRALRLTMINRLNMANPEKYSEMIEISGADYVEVKAYMFVGFSRRRLKMDNMPSHNHIREFAERIAELTGYRIAAESGDSRAVLLKK